MAKQTRQFVIDSARSIAASGVTPTIEVAQDDGYFIESVFTGIQTGATGTATLQVSLSGTVFSDYPSSAQNFSDATTVLSWEVDTKRHKYARIMFDDVSGGSGTVTTTYFGEVFVE